METFDIYDWNTARDLILSFPFVKKSVAKSCYTAPANELNDFVDALLCDSNVWVMRRRVESRDIVVVSIGSPRQR